MAREFTSKVCVRGRDRDIGKKERDPKWEMTTATSAATTITTNTI